MAYLHEQIDFTAAILVAEGGRGLLVHHRQLQCWLPLGGETLGRPLAPSVAWYCRQARAEVR